MMAAIARLKRDGWEAQGNADFGFVFIRNSTDRRLLMLTARDPYSCELQRSHRFDLCARRRPSSPFHF